MTAEELIKRLSDAEDRATIQDRDAFMGSPVEAAEADGKADAYSNARAWVEEFLRTPRGWK